jgi:hypothetical protein
LMLAFIGGISRALARGETPDCNCFGALHSARVGWRALARNVALAALAAFVAVRGPGPSITAWVGDRSALELVALGAGILAAALLAWALRMWWVNRALRRHLVELHEVADAIPPGLPVGAMAPDFEVMDVDGDTLTLRSLRARGLPIALLLTPAGCGSSENVLPELERLQEVAKERLTLGFVGRGSISLYRAGGETLLRDAVEQDPVLAEEMDKLLEFAVAYRMFDTPSAVILTPEGTIASATVTGRLAIEALLRVTMVRAAPSTATALAAAQQPAA